MLGLQSRRVKNNSDLTLASQHSTRAYTARVFCFYFYGSVRIVYDIFTSDRQTHP